MVSDGRRVGSAFSHSFIHRICGQTIFPQNLSISPTTSIPNSGLLSGPLPGSVKVLLVWPLASGDDRSPGTSRPPIGSSATCCCRRPARARNATSAGARGAVRDGKHRVFRAAGRGGCRHYGPCWPAAAGQITLFPHSRSSAWLTLMLFGIDPAGMVVPTIGPRGLASMYSITGASTFQPP